MVNNPNLWQNEYLQKGIPSSFRKAPSGTMEFLYQFLKENKVDLKNKIFLDLGCGSGRNAYSLIKNNARKVYAIDFVPSLIEKIKSQKIVAICADLTKPWPISSNSIDVAIDIFVFKHQTTLPKQQFYLSELKRILKTNGVLLISFAGINDGYYGSLPKIKIRKDVYKITDASTKIDSFLYSKESLQNEFKNFKLEKFKKETKNGPMHGNIYKRETLKFIFQKI